MAREFWRASRLSSAPVIVAMIVVIGGLAVLVRESLPPPDHKLVKGTDDVFPSSRTTGHVVVVHIPPDLGFGMVLALNSLQGLVNRQGGQIYLEPEDENNMSFLLPFIGGRYGLNVTRMDVDSFFRTFSSYASGLVVYNPSTLDTVNVATVVAGLDSYVMVDPQSVDRVSGLTNKTVELDLREPPWAGLSGVQLYRKSFQEFHSLCYENMLAVLPPDKVGVRDYLIAWKVWTFHLTPGPFSSQENIDFADEVMAATPHNIPILGWFEMPTLVEENFFVQSASRHGKFLVGGEFVPNISFLSSLPAPGQFNQRRIVPPPPALAEDGIYVNFAVPDGDNLDFIGGKMNAIWQDKVRGTMPITWSINPLLTELAPAILDYYYVNASEKDSFVAAPSGGGYLYPGFTPDDDLQEYLARAKNAMFAADLDTVWLLNSFRAYEIPYTEETLETYCTSLAPRGILLDYADQAVTRDVWMQEGQGVAAPVMRSTHLWSGMNNLIGKMMADIDAAPSRPHFFIVTVYPWTVELGDAVKALETLQKRYGDRVHAVSIENALSLVAQAFVDEARSALSDVQAQPLAAIDFWDHDAAISEMSQAVDHLSRQETSLAGLHAYLSLEKARRALATGVVLFLAIVIVAFLAMALLLGKPAKHERGARMAGARRWLAPGVGISALFFLFFAGLQKTMDYNFWTYASVFVAGALIVFAPRLQSLLEKSYGRNAWPVEASILAASGLFLLWEPWAFVPFACSTAMLLCRFMSGTARGKDAIFFGLGIGGTAFIRFDWISLAILTCLVAFLAHTLRPIAPPRPSGGKKEIATGVTFAATTLTLMVVWIVLYQNRYFAEKMNGGLDLQRALALIALVAAPVLALVAWKVMEPIRRMDAILTLSVATALWVVLWFAQGLLIVSCLVMALAVLMAWSFLSASSRVKWTGAMTARFASNLLILGTIVVVLVRFPAIVYSLYVVRNLPVAVEYILYTPPLLMIFATIDVIQTEALFRAARRGPGPSAEASEDA